MMAQQTANPFRRITGFHDGHRDDGCGGFFLSLFPYRHLIANLVHLEKKIPRGDIEGFHLGRIDYIFPQQQPIGIHPVFSGNVCSFGQILVTLVIGHQSHRLAVPQILPEEHAGGTVTVTERRLGKSVMESLPDYVVKGSQCVMESFHLKRKRAPFAQTPPPLVFCIEEPGIRIACPAHDLLRTVRLYQFMEMSRQEALRQQTGISFQNGQRKCIEAATQVGFTPEQHFIVGRETDMKGFSHGIPFYYSFTNLSHVSIATARRTDEMLPIKIGIIC